MNMDGNSHPFQVSVWSPPQPALKYMGNSYWLEMCRCQTDWRAKEIAECLSIRHRLVIVSQLDGDQFVPSFWLPDKATVERETGNP